MRQWREVKASNRDALVFFRVGDFYELFYGDAEEGARLLGLTLTSRNNGGASRVPLAGVPVKALDEYLGRLVACGRRVAICEQVEDPALAEGIVRREVVETVTPGTVLHDKLLASKRNNFLVAIAPAPTESTEVGLAAVDLSTGELFLQSVPHSILRAELGRLEPAEILLGRSFEDDVDAVLGGEGMGVLKTFRDDWLFDYGAASDELLRRYRIHSLSAFGLQATDTDLVRAGGALLAYLAEVRPNGIEHLRPPRIQRRGEVMVLDEMTRRNLELVEPLRSGEEGGTLLDVLDDTATAMGARLLRRWVLTPLVTAEAIWERQEAVTEFVEDPERRSVVREALGRVTDMERLAGKVGAKRVTPRDLLALERSLAVLPALQEAAVGCVSEALRTSLEAMDVLDDVRARIERAIAPDAPANLQDGGYIRSGFDEALDDLRAVRDGARDFIASLQTREREATGIPSLKVGFNKVFGYYLEVTRANLAKVPESYIRKQTLANAERYFTPELKEWEEKVFGAEDRLSTLEATLFTALRESISSEVARLQAAADRVAKVDVLSTLAEVARRRRYVRPDVHTGMEVVIRGGRHPVVETMMPVESFIPNDLTLTQDERIVILTGPNMAGKSTVLRQVGLIHLMAQIGAFVPADAAKVPVCDRIFTRVGASDNLARGQSTFMVEMNETAAIVHGATERSLVLLDEIGRGTSTYDGVSIAWAVTEHLHEHVGAKTIFATHYHELTQLGDLLPGVRNMNVSVRESGEEIIFLRRLEEGGADRSYGIQVARLAGFPEEVLARARELLTELEGTHSGGGEGLGRRGRHRPRAEAPPDQLSMFRGPEPAVLRRLREMDPDALSPLEALRLLFELKAEMDNNDGRD